MKGAYIRTNFNYLLYCIPIFLCMVAFNIFLFMLNANPLNGPLMAVLTFCDGYWLVKSVIETVSRRRAQREALENGSCVRARVKNLLKVKYEECYINGAGDIHYKNAYCIEAVSYDNYGNEVVYRSDVIYTRRAKHIPSAVLVYEYGEKTHLVWEDAAEKTNYPVVQSEEIIKGYKPKLKLLEINYILLFVGGISSIIVFIFLVIL